MVTRAEHAKRTKLRQLRTLIKKAQIVAAELGASAVIVTLVRARDEVEETISGKLSCG